MRVFLSSFSLIIWLSAGCSDSGAKADAAAPAGDLQPDTELAHDSSADQSGPLADQSPSDQRSADSSADSAADQALADAGEENACLARSGLCVEDDSTCLAGGGIVVPEGAAGCLFDDGQIGPAARRPAQRRDVRRVL